MKLLKSSLALFMGLSAIAFVAVVDGAKSSKRSKSSKSSKSSSSSSSKSSSVSIVTETITVVNTKANAFTPPESFESLRGGRKLTDAGSRKPRNQHEQRLLEHLTNNSKFMEKVNDLKKQRNLQFFSFPVDGLRETILGNVVDVSDDGVFSPVDTNRYFTQICTIIDGDYESTAGEVSVILNNVECTVNLCTGEGDCLNLLLSSLGEETYQGGATKTLYSVVSGRGKYFGVTGQAQLMGFPNPVPPLGGGTFEVKYIPSTLSEAQLAAVQLF